MHASSTGVSGYIDYDSINRRRFQDDIHFNDFYRYIIDYVKARLGYSVIRVELTDFMMMSFADEAISRLDAHAPDWCLQHMTFITEANISYYKLPRFVLNNFRYAAYKKSLLSIASQNGTLEFDFFIKYFQDNFLFSDFAVSDFLILQMHLEQIRKILGRDGSFRVVGGEYLFLSPAPTKDDSEEVVVEYKSLNAATIHHFYLSWLQRFALSNAKITLGTIRGKYATLPSPDGGASLDGPQLLAQGNMEREMLIEELLTEIEEPPTFTMF